MGLLRRIDHRGAGARVAGDDDEPARPFRTPDAFRGARRTVGQADRLALLQLPPQRPLGHARRPRLLGIEATGPLVLPHRVADRATPVLGREHLDGVAVPLRAARCLAPSPPPPPPPLPPPPPPLHLPH